MPIAYLFHKHPASVGESYCQHLQHASAFGLRMIFGGVACIVHGLLPFVFIRTGSQQVATLHDRMVLNRAAPLPGIFDFVI